VLKLLAVIGMLLPCIGCVAPERSADATLPSAPLAGSIEPIPGDLVPARGRFVLVDTSAFELIAYQDGSPVLRSRIIVGRPGASTPEMNSRLYAIRFNPAWFPTPAMIRNEGAHYVPPGPQNPLGRLLFEIENSQLIYLHDTNDRSLFNNQNRALSHGCVRVEQARQLAAWALDVPLARIDELISRGATLSVPLPRSIPVSLVHRTAPRSMPVERFGLRIIP